MGAEHKPHKRIVLLQAFCHMLLLHHTAAHGDQRVGMPRFDVLQGTHIAEHAIHCVFPHGTGVKKDEIGVFGFFREAEAHFRQHALDAFGVRDVLLTAESADMCQRRQPALVLRVICLYLLRIGFLPTKLFFFNMLDVCHR